MKVEVLISCMFQADVSALIKRSNIQSDVLVINQCDVDKTESFAFLNKAGESCTARIIHTTERGVSRSRNMAIRNATGDICVVCDDDEIFEDDYPLNIADSYTTYSDCSVLAFEIKNRVNNKGFKRNKRISKLDALHLCSVQITFRRDKIMENNILFNESLGAGASKAGGEEQKFLFDCIDSCLKVRNIPIYIAALISNTSETSTWRGQYTEAYFIDKGVSSRILFGRFWAAFYAIYTLVAKYKRYRKDISPVRACRSILYGIYKKS